MMLAHPLLQSPIEFKENRVPVLIVENGQLFRRLIGDLLAQENGEPGEFALSENAGLIEIGKNVQMTLNPLFPELDGRRIATKIQQMAVTAAEDQPGKTAECLAALNDYGAALTAAIPFNVTFSEMESADDVVKALAFRVDTEEMSVPEQLLEMMRLHRECFRKRLFVFVNLKSFFSENEITLFYQSVFYEKLSVLLLESGQKEPVRPCEEVRIIDKDLCEF